jgi:ZIP family zinc transporter
MMHFEETLPAGSMVSRASSLEHADAAGSRSGAAHAGIRLQLTLRACHKPIDSMHDALLVIGFTLAAGSAMAIGGLIACFEHIRPQWLEDEFHHAVIAFGGGALLSAVALVLVPEGAKELSTGWVVLCFAGGGVAFMLLDTALAAAKSPAAQLAAMLSDFIPEALALGAAFAVGGSTGPLLALLIGIQNLPEGFNAYRELTASSPASGRKVLIAFGLMALLGPVAGLTGLFVLSAYPTVVAGIMLFAAGGILYLTFQDLAPQARLDNHWAPPLGAVAGFLLGLVGQMMIG